MPGDGVRAAPGTQAIIDASGDNRAMADIKPYLKFGCHGT
jgi:hypothetical protein